MIHTPAHWWGWVIVAWLLLAIIGLPWLAWEAEHAVIMLEGDEDEYTYVPHLRNEVSRERDL